jgi:hypothetical protein
MKQLALAMLVAVAFVGSAIAESRITCEGKLEHGSGGEYIASKNKPTCWLGCPKADVCFDEAVLAVCKQGERCIITGVSTICDKDPDPHRCQQIIRLDSISH